MRDQSVIYDNKTFNYILTAVDVFSRFIFVRALTNKTAKNVAIALKQLFGEHGYPEIIQCDNGPEFFGDVQKLLCKNNVKIIRGRPYHPESQGKVERQNRIIRDKIRFDSLRSSSSGSNWVKRLPDVAEAINNQPKEVLVYQTPFQCYFGRGQNISADVIRKKAKIASERCQKRTVLAQNKKKTVVQFTREGTEFF